MVRFTDRSVLTSADGDPGKKPPRGWANVLPPWPPRGWGLAGCAGAAARSSSDSLEVKSEPQGRRRIEKLSQDQKGDGQMGHRSSTLSISVQDLELDHV